jgi:hypothetical protein
MTFVLRREDNLFCRFFKNFNAQQLVILYYYGGV